jgi:heme-degrading monooxygenase HmoA
MEERAMFMRIGWGRLKPGHWDAYQADYERAHKGLQVPGRLASYLVQDVEHADSGFIVTLWRAREDIEAYDRSEVRKAMMSEFNDHFTGQFGLQVCRVVFQEETPAVPGETTEGAV